MMAIERTLSIIKPDAVAKQVIGQIYSRFEDKGLRVIAAKMAHLSKDQAEQFYAIHKEVLPVAPRYFPPKVHFHGLRRQT